jgi:antitoxin (DNA-binding transcriptional repressor) of toxin-antitoxin stability system
MVRMETIAIAELKAHLSEHVRKAAAGARIVILDHKRPVAMMTPLQEEIQIAKPASGTYRCPALTPLVDKDPLAVLLEERGDT